MNNGDDAYWASVRADWESVAAHGPVPPGRYPVAFHGGRLDRTSARDTPLYRIDADVTAGPHRGRRLFKEIYLTQKAIPFAKDLLARFNKTSWADLETPLEPGFVGEITVKHREGDGSPRNKIDQVDAIRFEPAASFDRAYPEF